MESDYPFFRVEDYSLRCSSGGNGKFRGGMGFQKIYKILSDNVTFATYGDRFRIAPEGVLGGGPGAQAETFVERGNQIIQLESKQQFILQKGDRLVVRTGGGGGYGVPSERSTGLKEDDKLNGISTNQD